MWRTILASLLVLVSALSPLHAQAAGQPADAEQPSYALAWTVAALCTIVILLVVCMPSRKGHSEE